jgi:hypothetical protein
MRNMIDELALLRNKLQVATGALDAFAKKAHQVSVEITRATGNVDFSTYYEPIKKIRELAHKSYLATNDRSSLDIIKICETLEKESPHETFGAIPGRSSKNGEGL